MTSIRILGINLQETKDWPTKVTPVSTNKTLVIIYTCGGNEGDGAFTKDYLGPYLKEVFSLIGYNDVKILRIEGSMNNRNNLITDINKEVESVAKLINDRFV